MKRPPIDRTDPRTVVEEQHITVSYGGISKERGPNGSGELVPFVLGGAFCFEHTVVTASDVVPLGDIPAGVVLTGLTVVGGITAGTVTLAIEARGGAAAATLAAAQSVTTTGARTFTTLRNTVTRRLTATFATATAGATVRFVVLALPWDKQFS